MSCNLRSSIDMNTTGEDIMMIMTMTMTIIIIIIIITIIIEESRLIF